MALKIYKPGQGYWTRLLSGIAAGVLIIAGAQWLSTQLEAFNFAYTESGQVTLEAEAREKISDSGSGEDLIRDLGIRELESPSKRGMSGGASAGNGQNGEDSANESAPSPLILKELASDSLLYRSGLRRSDRIVSVDGRPVSNREDLVAAVRQAGPDQPVTIQYNREKPVVMYVKAGVFVIVVGGFGLLVFRWVGHKPRTCDFLIATEGEMKKVNWPSRKEIVGSTWVVIACVVMLALLLLVADLGFASFFRYIGILDV